jgi:hypothetical protein
VIFLSTDSTLLAIVLPSALSGSGSIYLVSPVLCTQQPQNSTRPHLSR